MSVVNDPTCPPMFVSAASRYAERLCQAVLTGPLTVARAGELAEIHRGHQCGDCAVLPAAVTRLRADDRAARAPMFSGHLWCEKGTAVFDPVSGSHDCDQDPGPIGSPVLALALAGAVRECDRQRCLLYRRIAQALGEFLEADPDVRDSGWVRQCQHRPAGVRASQAAAGVFGGALVEMPWRYCRIDPGPVSQGFGHMLVMVHGGCDKQVCRAAQRAWHALLGDPPVPPVPECAVPDEQIATAVGRTILHYDELQSAQFAMRAGQLGAETAMRAALTAVRVARRDRNVLFLRALPGDGTIPLSIITRFGMSLREIRLLGLLTETPAGPR